METLIQSLPYSLNRMNFAAGMYAEAVVEFPNCQIFAGGINHQTFVMDKVGQSLFDAALLPQFQLSLATMGFRRVVITSEHGQVHTEDLVDPSISEWEQEAEGVE